MVNHQCSVLAGLLVVIVGNAARAGDALPQAHAHNDYRHSRPLLDALQQGFCSVEADIYLVDGELLVGHDPWELKPERTLESLYLKPLLKRVRANGGFVHEEGVPFQLLIDFKSHGVSTYNALQRTLGDYRQMLTEVRGKQVVKRAVTVVISGNRPIEHISQQSERLAAIDGRLGDLESQVPSHLMPLISDRWTSHFQWRGEGEFPASEQAKLREIARKTHAAGRQLRFWATPDVQSVWRVLHDAGVDYINTDDLTGLAEFLREKKQLETRR